MRRVIANLLVLLGICLVPYAARAVDDSNLEYFTIETPHFYVHYYSGTEDLALRVAITCEEAHAALVPLLDWVPVKTHVNVVDKSDVANGSANVYGRNLMNIYGMPPEADSVLGFYDDWLRVLVYHEYTHILHIDTKSSIFPYINYVAGKVLAPNQTLPRWYVEGLATYHESNRTRGGRVNGALWDMWARAAALEGTFVDLGAATGLPVQWPAGNSAYLYGSLFLDWVFEHYGEDWGTRFNHEYGSRIIPWSLNTTAKEISGVTVEELWNQWTAHALARAEAQRVAVEAAGESKLQMVSSGDGGAHGYARLRPRFNTMTFFYNDFLSKPRYVEVQPGGELRDLVSVDGAFGPSSWSPDGMDLYFSQASPLKGVYNYQDIFAWNARTKSIRRITRGERAREPEISPDGRWLVYVRNDHGTMELVVRDLKFPTESPRVLTGGTKFEASNDAHWQQIATPRFSPDSSSVVYSAWRLDTGARDLWLVPVNGGSTRRLTANFALDLDPVFADQNHILFSSDRTGILNIFEYDLKTTEIRQLTNVTIGVTAPLRLGDRLYVTTYGADGYDVAWTPLTAAPPRVEPSVAVQDRLPPREYPTIDTREFKTTDYQSARWLLPQFFNPEFSAATSGTSLSGTVSGNDPLRQWNWELAAAKTFGQSIEEQGYSVGLSSSYRGLPVDVSVLARFREAPTTRDYFVANDNQFYLSKDWVVQTVVSRPFPGILDDFSMSASYTVQNASYEELPYVDPDPGDLEPIRPEAYWLNSLSLGLSYSDIERFPRSVSAERGFAGSVALSVQDPILGSDVEAVTVSYGLSGYLPNPLIHRHVFAALYSGGHASALGRGPGNFGLGGNAPQDVLSSVIFQDVNLRRVLRGYPVNFQVGPNLQLLSLSYRFPILDLDEGFGTLPVFFRQLKGDIFFESGAAYSGFLADADVIHGVGAEVVLNTRIAYYLGGNLRLGYARGLSDGGINEIYFLYGGGF